MLFPLQAGLCLRTWTLTGSLLAWPLPSQQTLSPGQAGTESSADPFTRADWTQSSQQTLSPGQPGTGPSADPLTGAAWGSEQPTALSCAPNFP